MHEMFPIDSYYYRDYFNAEIKLYLRVKYKRLWYIVYLMTKNKIK